MAKHESQARTTPDDLAERHFGPDKPALERGPVLTREDLVGGMICRYQHRDKMGEYVVHTFQLPVPTGEMFTLFQTAQLSAKLKNTRRGEVVRLTYLGQDEDEDRMHRWSVEPYSGTAQELANIVKQSPWKERIVAFLARVKATAQVERERRKSRGDGAPAHEDADFPFP